MMHSAVVSTWGKKDVVGLRGPEGRLCEPLAGSSMVDDLRKKVWSPWSFPSMLLVPPHPPTLIHAPWLQHQRHSCPFLRHSWSVGAIIQLHSVKLEGGIHWVQCLPTTWIWISIVKMLGYGVLLTSHHTIAHKGTYEVKMRPGATSSLLRRCQEHTWRSITKHSCPCGLPLSHGEPHYSSFPVLDPSAVFSREVTALYPDIITAHCQVWKIPLKMSMPCPKSVSCWRA